MLKALKRFLELSRPPQKSVISHLHNTNAWYGIVGVVYEKDKDRYTIPGTARWYPIDRFLRAGYGPNLHANKEVNEALLGQPVTTWEHNLWVEEQRQLMGRS